MTTSGSSSVSVLFYSLFLNNPASALQGVRCLNQVTWLILKYWQTGGGKFQGLWVIVFPVGRPSVKSQDPKDGGYSMQRIWKEEFCSFRQTLSLSNTGWSSAIVFYDLFHNCTFSHNIHDLNRGNSCFICLWYQSMGKGRNFQS